MNQDIIVTVFTPTYNRNEMIGLLYQSLLRQTVKNFEWIVIDDGNDQTQNIMKEIAKKNETFPITYVRKKGEKGINRSYNIAVKMAKGKLFMKVDDDDTLSEDAIKQIIKFEKTIEVAHGFAGVSGLRAHNDGKVIGGDGNKEAEYTDATNLDRRKYNLLGDKAEAYYTNVLKKYGPMPEVEGETYTWESLLWDKIAHNGLKIRWFKEIIYYTEYLPGGATDGEKKAKYSNFKTYTLVVKQKVSYDEVSFLEKIKFLCRYFEIARIKRISYLELKNEFKNNYILTYICFNLSYITKYM